MIPSFSWQTISFGPVTLQVWGLCVALGSLIALFFCLRDVKNMLGVIPAQAGIQSQGDAQRRSEVMWSVFFWLIFGGFIGARIFHVLFYEWNYYSAHQWEIFMFWHGGASSLGGFIGALFALYIFLKIKKLTWADFKPYARIIGVWFWLAWAIGRLGCFFIHDHIGRLTNFFLAVNFPDGARFDLGFLDSILSLIIFLILFGLRRSRQAMNEVSFPLLGFLLYAAGRFILDFLRADDVVGADARYWQFTPAQWGIVIFFIAIIAVKVGKKRQC